MNEVERVAQALVDAERAQEPIGPASDLVEGGLSLGVAHAICEYNVARRLEAGEHIAGFKVGFTNISVREKMGLPDSTYGYLFDSMVLDSGGSLAMDELIAPKIETEICFRLKDDLSGTGLTVDEVLAATDAVAASFEICDARIRDWKCPYPDFFADDGFSARIVLSDRWIPVDEIDLLGETVALSKDDKIFAEGVGAMALGHPAKAVAWLAGKLAERDRGLKAGNLVMTGTLTPITPIERGSAYEGAFSTLGTVTKAFA